MAKNISRETLYTGAGTFQFCGAGTFVIRRTCTIGKPYALVFVTSHNGNEQEEFLGAFQTISGAKARAAKFGTWTN